MFVANAVEAVTRRRKRRRKVEVDNGRDEGKSRIKGSGGTAVGRCVDCRKNGDGDEEVEKEQEKARRQIGTTGGPRSWRGEGEMERKGRKTARKMTRGDGLTLQ